MACLVGYALPACMIGLVYGQLSQSDTGRLNLLFRQAHRWQLTGLENQIYTVNIFMVTADRKK